MRRIMLIIIIAGFIPVVAQDSLYQKIGQMIMVGFAPGTNFEDTLFYDIENRNLGGVIYFGYNLQNPAQISNLSEDLQDRAPTPLLIATDQEGGVVARLDENNGFEKTLTAFELGTLIDNEDSTRMQAEMMAEWLSMSGINTNLAPVVDVNVNPASPAIGYYGRSYSSDPLKVKDHAAWYIDEFDRKNIISTIKHFPGHGSAEDDSHLGFTDVTNTWTDSELIPYGELINAGYSDMVMTGHLYNANLDSVFPASLSSKTITGILRDSLGFQGVVVSDEMFMRAISDNYTFEEAIVLAINAGTDILLYSTNEYNGASLVAEVIRIVRDNIDAGLIQQSRIDAAYQRIMTLKSRITGLPLASVNILPETFDFLVYPNPSNSETNIKLELRKAGKVQIQIFDISGKQIYNKLTTWLSAGRHVFKFNGSALATGVYFVRVGMPGFSQVRKITLIK